MTLFSHLYKKGISNGHFLNDNQITNPEVVKKFFRIKITSFCPFVIRPTSLFFDSSFNTRQ